jgi:hypothetical protein
MNPVLAELLHGAGLSDIVIPRKESMKALNGGFFNLNAFRSMPSGTKAILSSALKPVSEGLVPALGQVAEHIIPLIGKGDMEGGKIRTTKASGFIRRLMYENSLKHDGQYKYPVWKLHKDSEMDEPKKFVYKELANKQQDGDRDTEYGASPFIQKHFGTNRAVEFVRGRKHKKGDPKQESEAQREKRKDYPYRQKRKASKQQPQQSVEQQEERQPLVVADNKPEVAEERPEDVAEDDKKYAEEHSVERTQSEYDRMFPKKSASKEKESLRKKEAYKRGKEEAKNRQYDYNLPEIPDELKPFIKEEELEVMLPDLVRRAKIKLLYKKAREALPPYRQWKTTPAIITLIDKVNSKRTQENMNDRGKDTEENRVYDRIQARIDELKGERRGIIHRERRRFLDEDVDEMIQSQLPDPGITKENVATYKIPKKYF